MKAPSVRKSKPAEAVVFGFPSNAAVVRQLEEGHDRCLRSYLKAVSACRLRQSHHRVHRLRIAIRRLLACRSLLVARELRGGALSFLRAQLKALGNLRDAQLGLKLIKSSGIAGPSVEPLRHFFRRRTHRQKNIIEGLLSEEIDLRGEKKPRLRCACTDRELVARLRRKINGSFKRAFDPLAISSSGSPADPVSRHHIRILRRQYCYMMEAIRPGCFGRGTGQVLPSLEPYLEAIGKVHNHDVLLGRIDSMVARQRLVEWKMRPLCALLRSERARLLASASRMDRRVVHEAMVGGRFLNGILPPRRKARRRWSPSAAPQ